MSLPINPLEAVRQAMASIALMKLGKADERHAVKRTLEKLNPEIELDEYVPVAIEALDAAEAGDLKRRIKMPCPCDADMAAERIIEGFHLTPFLVFRMRL